MEVENKKVLFGQSTALVVEIADFGSLTAL